MNDAFVRVESVLFRSWICGFVVLFVWLIATLLMSDRILALHGRLFGLNPHEVHIVMYAGMGLWKMGVIVFYFIPWLALRMTRRSVQRQA